MCGYVRRHITNKALREFLQHLGLPDLYPDNEEAGDLRHYYPAFGGAASRTIPVIIRNESAVVVDATWWFDCTQAGDGLVVNNGRTTFNARNLTSQYWRGAIRHHRGVLVVTGLGEGKMTNGKNTQFLIESDLPLLLGCVYRPFPNGCYSAAIITRDRHLRFEKYHDKAFPLMLPHDAGFLDLWLSGASEDEPAIANLLENPKIFNDLKVTPVKTFKDAKPTGPTENLAADSATL